MGGSGSGRKLRNAHVVYGILYIVLICAHLIPILLLTNIHPYFIWMISSGSAAFLMMGIDKATAKIGKIRIPEILFHAIYLLGGFTGGFMGMLIFGHKVGKSVFKIMMAVSLTAHIIIFIAYLMVGGSI